MAAQSADSDGRATKRLGLSMADGMCFSNRQLPIIVGDEAENESKTFYASSDILAQHSDFFAAALRNGWKEKEEHLVRLPECKPELFEVFLKFIHTGKIYSSKDGDVLPDDEDDGIDEEWPRLTKCWAQGEQLMSTTFRDAIADTLIQKMAEEERYPLCLHECVYPSTSTPNAASRLVVDIAVWKWSEENILNVKKDHTENSEYLSDLALRLFTLTTEEREGPAPFEKADCTYHDHVKAGKSCYKTMFKYD